MSYDNVATNVNNGILSPSSSSSSSPPSSSSTSLGSPYVHQSAEHAYFPGSNGHFLPSSTSASQSLTASSAGSNSSFPFPASSSFVSSSIPSSPFYSSHAGVSGFPSMTVVPPSTSLSPPVQSNEIENYCFNGTVIRFTREPQIRI